MKRIVHPNRSIVEGIQLIQNADSGLPRPGRRRNPDGTWRDVLPGEPGWTLRVYDIDEVDGEYSIPVDDAMVEKMQAARGKPSNARDARERALARVPESAIRDLPPQAGGPV